MTIATKRNISMAGLLILWFAAAYVLGTGHYMANDQQSFLAPIILSVALPVAIFLAAYGLWQPFRAFVLSQDIRTLTMLQGWRVIGFGFLLLYFFDVLPGIFAWPARLGDVTIGLMAPILVLRLNRDPDAAPSSGLIWFHLAGMLDFLVAAGTAMLASGAFPVLIPSGLTSAQMDVWPISLFPSFIVPVFINLHLSVLVKIRHLSRSALPTLAPAHA